MQRDVERPLDRLGRRSAFEHQVAVTGFAAAGPTASDVIL
jgi:hypothetical protein